MIFPPLSTKIMLESSPLKSIILVRRLAVRPFSYLRLLEVSIKSPDESRISRWSLEVWNTNLMFLCSKSRLWDLKYEHLKKNNYLSSLRPSNVSTYFLFTILVFSFQGFQNLRLIQDIYIVILKGHFHELAVTRFLNLSVTLRCLDSGDL